MKRFLIYLCISIILLLVLLAFLPGRILANTLFCNFWPEAVQYTSEGYVYPGTENDNMVFPRRSQAAMVCARDKFKNEIHSSFYYLVHKNDNDSYHTDPNKIIIQQFPPERSLPTITPL